MRVRAFSPMSRRTITRTTSSCRRCRTYLDNIIITSLRRPPSRVRSLDTAVVINNKKKRLFDPVTAFVHVVGYHETLNVI